MEVPALWRCGYTEHYSSSLCLAALPAKNGGARRHSRSCCLRRSPLWFTCRLLGLADGFPRAGRGSELGLVPMSEPGGSIPPNIDRFVGSDTTAGVHTARGRYRPRTGFPPVSELLESPEMSPTCTAGGETEAPCRKNLAKATLNAGTGAQMCQLLRGCASSCAGGKGEAHWAPRQPRAPPLTFSRAVRGPRAPGRRRLGSPGYVQV